MSRFHTIKGIFGQLIHYKDGIKVGESWKGLFDGSYNHYSSSEGYVGYSDPGLLADQVHHDANGKYVGESWKDDFGVTRHYDSNGFAGESVEDIFGGAKTNIFDNNQSDIFHSNKPDIFESDNSDVFSSGNSDVFSSDDSSGFDW